MSNSPEIIHLKLEPDLDPEHEKLCEHGPDSHSCLTIPSMGMYLFSYFLFNVAF